MKRKNRPDRDFSSVHKTRIIKETKISKSKIKPGTIVRFNYKGKDVHEPRPLVLVLNPRWKGKLHGIALRVLSESELIKLADIVRENLTKKIAMKLKHGLRTNTASISNPQSFYKARIKRYIARLKETPYRTYNTKGISSTNVIDYKFKDMWRGNE